MNLSKKTYIIINIITIFAALYFFINAIITNFSDTYIKEFWFPFITLVAMIHLIKALRLYIAFYDTGINRLEYVKTFCKVTPVSIIFPFKLGELFRIYCYGYLIKNWLKSTVIIFLDRFMDTIALVTILLFILFFTNKHPSLILFLLIAFLLFLLFAYKSFPNFYKFWKDYYLKQKATKRKLWSLKQLTRINTVYKELSAIIQGRAFILYLLSILAWVLELINLKIITDNIKDKVLPYILSALNMEKSTLLYEFITVSIVVLFSVYIFIKLLEIFKQRGR